MSGSAFNLDAFDVSADVSELESEPPPETEPESPPEYEQVSESEPPSETEPDQVSESEPVPAPEPALAQASLESVSKQEPEFVETADAVALKKLISRGLVTADIEHSHLSPEALSYMADVGDLDPAVRILLEQTLGRHLGQAYKRANKEAEVKIREAEARMKIEIREQVEQQKEKIHQQALAEALLTVRAEVASEYSEPLEDVPREFAKLRRVFS